MSLPPLLKHVYNHGTEEVVRRGKRIFHTAGVQMLDVDHLLQQVRFRVRNDIYQNYYTVTISRFNDPRQLSVRCQCPYNLGEICRHEVAALFQLNDIVQSGFFDNADITYSQQHTVVRMRVVSEQMVGVFMDPEKLETAKQWAKSFRAALIPGKEDSLEADVQEGEASWHVVIRQNEEKYYDTSCGCAETAFPLCVHKATVFLQVLQTKGSQYFQRMQNWDIQKNKLLEQYGYSLSDDLNGKFDFTYQDGKPFLRVLDPAIKKVTGSQPVLHQAKEETATMTASGELHLGIVIDAEAPWYPFVQLHLAAGQADGEEKAFAGPIEKLELQQYINALRFREKDRELLPVVRKFQPEEILKFLKKNLPFGDFLDDYQQVLKENPAPEVREQVWEYLLPKYQRLLERYASYPLTFIHRRGQSFTRTALEPVRFSARQVEPALRIAREKDAYSIVLRFRIGHETFAFGDVTLLNAGLMLFQDYLHALNNTATVQLVSNLLPDGRITIPEDEWPLFLEEQVMGWRQILPIDFSPDIIAHTDDVKPSLVLYLQERDRMLVLQPAFRYDGTEIKWGYQGDVMLPKDGRIRTIHRHEKSEAAFIQLVRNLHTGMQQSARDFFFYLPSEEVLAANWFFRFIDTMREHGVTLLGFDTLKQLRINTHRPQTRVQVSSGIDWFDAQVELTFGEQVVSITEVKKALAQRQSFVPLGDGTIGLLPEEWLKKYALLVKMGEAKGGKLRLKKFHFSVLDELLSEVDEEAVLQELEAKKEHLADIIDRDFSELLPPAQLKAELRPYQQAGFQWLAFLQEAGWGGILADDMGLGKTVQTLTFFQHYCNSHPGAKFMVVCPTTLMYNWEAEIRKFTPELRHFIHHGPKRTNNPRHFEAFDVVITTYGTMRSDIRMFKDYPFDYVVLDESQAIKNPQSQVAKASLLLNAKNRLALSGTPVQNNTFDLYAQMNFLNPGILGSREFFMNEFATPIDKFGEEEVKQQLRKLTYPFMLRRTKEQVAKDLPAKTETILYCEMGSDQRKIYNAYRNTYKSQILGMIDEKGIERSQMHILQGLTRLRQICDSPAILNEEEKFENHSIKQEELMREITENVGHHKALVFSQFLGMLALIRAELEEQGIPYSYFDGSSTSAERERAIRQFQDNEECRVFLISLKAGGVGLNLTAADYVYIIDPWWNPAVEQQAIDRTHRIGQTKNIFAYRLICKDTIEEKMLQLQERKRLLASDLVSDDNALMKKLTRDDIAFLLS